MGMVVQVMQTAPQALHHDWGLLQWTRATAGFRHTKHH